jgi:hypothetical protein
LGLGSKKKKGGEAKQESDGKGADGKGADGDGTGGQHGHKEL